MKNNFSLNLEEFSPSFKILSLFYHETRREVVRRHAPQPHKEPFSRYFDGCQGITAFFLAVLITHFALYLYLYSKETQIVSHILYSKINKAKVLLYKRGAYIYVFYQNECQGLDMKKMCLTYFSKPRYSSIVQFILHKSQWNSETFNVM